MSPNHFSDNKIHNMTPSKTNFEPDDIEEIIEET